MGLLLGNEQKQSSTGGYKPSILGDTKTVFSPVQVPYAAPAQTPSAVTYNPAEQISRLLIGAGKIVAPAVKPLQQAGNMIVEGNRLAYSDLPQAIINALNKNDAKSKKLLEDINNRLSGNGTFGAGFPEGFTNTQDAQKGFIEDPKKIKSAAGTGAYAGSLVVGGGELAAFRAGGKTALERALLGNMLVGGAGNAGFTVANNPNASFSDVARAASIGAVAAPLVVGAGVAAKGADKALKVAGKKSIQEFEKTAIGKKVIEAGVQVNQKLGSSLAVLKHEMKNHIDASGSKFNEKLVVLSGKVKSAGGVASRDLASAPELAPAREVLAGKSQKQVDEIGKQISAYQEAINTGKRTGVATEVPTLSGDARTVYEALNAHTKTIVTKLQESGLISKKTASEWLADNNYTRVQRKIDKKFQNFREGNASASISTHQAQQKLKGGTAEAINPLMSHYAWVHTAYSDIARNEMSKYVQSELKRAGKAKLITTKKKLPEGLTEAQRTAITQAEAKAKRQGTLSSFKDGVKQIHAVEPKIAESIKNLDNIHYGALGQAAMFLPRVLRVSATAVNPVFIIKNFARDQLGSAITSSAANKTHAPALILGGIRSAFRNNAGKETKAFGGVPQSVIDELYKIEGSQANLSLIRNPGAVWEAVVKDMKIEKSFKQKVSKLRSIEDFLSITETSTRVQNGVGAYKAAVKNGMTHEQALTKASYAARSNSADFLDRGEWAKGLAIINPYLPASIAGSRTILKAIAERPASTSMKIAGLVMLPTILSTYNNLSDPDKAAYYASLPESLRENNLIVMIKVGGQVHALSTPLPPGYKEMTKPMRNLIEAQYLDNRKSFTEYAKNLLVDPFSPVGTSSNEVLSSLVPQGAKQVIEAKANYNMFFGDKIVSDSLSKKPASEQVAASTSSTYRDLGKLFGVSPLIAKNTVTGLAPGAGEMLVNALDNIERVAGRKDNVVEKRGFTGQLKSTLAPDRGSNLTTQLYKTSAVTQKVRTQNNALVTEAVKNGDLAKAVSIAEKNNKAIELYYSKLDKSYGKYFSSEDRAKFDKLKAESQISTNEKYLKNRAKN